MHVHTDIDVVHQVTPASHFQLVPTLVAVDAAEDDVALAERFGIVLPPAGEAPHARARLQPVDHHLRDVQLRSFGDGVDRLRSHQSIEIRILDDIAVVEHIALEPDMGELLNNMRTATTGAGNADG